MKLREIYNKKDIREKISFEVFPPKDTDLYKKLIDEICKIKKFNPAFISLTWGASGSDNNSLSLAKMIKENGFNVMPHFTCVCCTKAQVYEHIKDLDALEIENILALRGDIPEDKSRCKDDFNYANELVEFIKTHSELSIGVAGYPEGHIEAESIQEDISNLKKKINAGADAIFTQLFFDNRKFFSYIEKLRTEGITIPVIAGIMPILSKKQILKMTSLARITIPQIIQEKLDKYSQEDIQKFGIEYASKQCENLINANVDGLHFFTLNNTKLSIEILNNIL